MNNNMKRCKSCGKEIAKSAKVCPSCGAKNKKHTVLGVVLVIFGILLIVAAFGGSNDSGPKKVPSTTDANQTPTASVAPVQTEFGVGEAVELNDIIVTLVDVSQNSGRNYMKPTDGKVFVVCEFEIENNSQKDIAISSILSFEAYIDDYSTAMNLSAMLSTDKTQLDGTVAAGKKMNGVIGYEAASDWSEIEIRFTPDFWSGKDITFKASR